MVKPTLSCTNTHHSCSLNILGREKCTFVTQGLSNAANVITLIIFRWLRNLTDEIHFRATYVQSMVANLLKCFGQWHLWLLALKHVNALRFVGAWCEFLYYRYDGVIYVTYCFVFLSNSIKKNFSGLRNKRRTDGNFRCSCKLLWVETHILSPGCILGEYRPECIYT